MKTYKDLTDEQRKVMSAKANQRQKEARLKARLVDGLPIQPAVTNIRIDIRNATPELVNAIRTLEKLLSEGK